MLPPGTEKNAVSWNIHKEDSSFEAPFLFIDIKNVRLNRQEEDTTSWDSLQVELAQDSTLFGHLQGSLSCRIFHQAQTLAQRWQDLLFLSGGTLAPAKCFYYAVKWNWEEGRATMTEGD